MTENQKKYWDDLKEKHPDTLLLFRCGDFYEAYGEDAKECARILGITLTYQQTDKTPMAGFPHHALDTYLPRLIRAGKRVAICDFPIEPPKGGKKTESTNNQKSEEDNTMRLNINNNNEKKNETKNVQTAAQVMNTASPAIEDAQAEEIESVSVGEMTIDAIQPVMQPIEGSEYEVKDDQGKDVKFASMAPNIGSEPAEPVENTGRARIVVAGVPKPTEKPKVTLKRKQSQPDPEAVGELAGMLTKVTLVTYTTKRGETAPRIVGFSGEDDPRWKPIYDEKQALVAEYNKAKKKDPKAKMTSSPFGPAWLTDREGNGEKQYCMTFGVRYMDVARKLCEAYNTTDREAWKQAEQAVRQTKQGIVSDYQAEKAARRAERERLRVGDGTSGMAQKAAAQAQPEPAPAMSDDDRRMFDLFKRFMQNDPEVVAMVNERKAA